MSLELSSYVEIGGGECGGKGVATLMRWSRSRVEKIVGTKANLNFDLMLLGRVTAAVSDKAKGHR